MSLGSPQRFSIRYAAAAQLSSNLWVGVIGLAFVPVYIRFLGMEAYGLLGLWATLQGLASVLDLGLSTTVNRELARLATVTKSGESSRDLVRSLEAVYWAIAAVIGIGIALIVPYIANRWVTTENLTPHEVETALWLVAVVMAFQWPFSFYAGGLTGLNRQVALGGLTSVVAVLRAVGAVMALAFVAPTIQVFLTWQAVIGVVSTCWVGVLLWKSLPPAERPPRFRREQIKKCFRFAAGVSFISATGMLLLQSDKIILSRLLRLEEFAYYSLAGTVGMSLLRLVTPLFAAVFPAMTRAEAGADQLRLQRLYHQTAEAASVLVFPLAVILVLFPKEVLFVWTGSRPIAARGALLVAPLAAGYAMQAIAHVPWALQLSHGWLRLAASMNIGALAVIGPLLYVLTTRYGAVGGAISWLLLQTGVLAAGQVLVHRRLLQGHLGAWCVKDVGKPLLAVLAPALVTRLFINSSSSRFMLAVLLGLVAVASGVSATLAVGTIRDVVKAEASKVWRRLARNPAQ